MSRSWMYDSSLLVAVKGLGLPLASGQTPLLRPMMTSALGIGVKLAVVMIFGSLLFTRDRENWSRAAELHYRYLLAVMFPLMVAPIVWEHYLALLYLPLIYVVASRQHFSTVALKTIGLIFFLAIGQNLILVLWLNSHLDIDSFSKVFVLGLLKSAPLVLTLFFVWRHRNELWKSYGAEIWRQPLT